MEESGEEAYHDDFHGDNTMPTSTNVENQETNDSSNSPEYTAEFDANTTTQPIFEVEREALEAPPDAEPPNADDASEYSADFDGNTTMQASITADNTELATVIEENNSGPHQTESHSATEENDHATLQEHTPIAIDSDTNSSPECPTTIAPNKDAAAAYLAEEHSPTSNSDDKTDDVPVVQAAPKAPTGHQQDTLDRPLQAAGDAPASLEKTKTIPGSHEAPKGRSPVAGKVDTKQPLEGQFGRPKVAGASSASATKHAGTSLHQTGMHGDCPPTNQTMKAADHAPAGSIAMHTFTGAKLTFTSPPYVPRAKPQNCSNYSHNKFATMEISRENEILVQKLTDIGQRRPSAAGSVAPAPAAADKALPCKTASSAVNRKKAMDEIGQANLALYKRLQAIKPSKDTSRDTLAKSHQQQIQYGKNCSNFKVAPKQEL